MPLQNTHATRPPPLNGKVFIPLKGRNDKKTSTQNRNSSEPLILVAHSVAVLVQLANKNAPQVCQRFFDPKKMALESEEEGKLHLIQDAR